MFSSTIAIRTGRVGYSLRMEPFDLPFAAFPIAFIISEI